MMLSATRTLWLTARAKCARRTSLAATRVCAGKARCLSTGACDATAAVGEGVRPTERRPDEYAWMRCRDSDELKEHIRAENGFTIQSLQPSADLAQQLHHELCAYTAPAPGVLAADSLPEKWGAFEYWTDSAGEGPRMVRRRCGDPSDKSDAASSSGSSLAKDEVLLDFGALSDQYDAPHVHVATVSVSPDGAMLAFTMDACGTEEYRGVVRRLCATPCGFGEDLVGDEIASATRVTWANVPHPHLLYCVVPDDAGRPCEVWRHTVGSNRSEDERVFASSDAADWVDVVSVKDNQVITINCNTKSSSEVWILDACDRHASPKLVARREADVSYFVEHNKGWLYIVTNRDGADNFKVVRAPVTDPAASNWEDVVPPRAGVILNDLDMYDDHLLLYETVDGRPRLTVVSLATLDASSASPHQLPPPVPIRLPADVCGIDPGANQDVHARTSRFQVITCTAPPTVCDLDIATGEVHELGQNPVPGFDSPFDNSRYTHRRVMATSHDGVQVPVDVVHKSDLNPQHRNPLLMQVYGAYGAELDARFEAQNLPLLERGWGIAFAHVRGGGELGRAWHDAGRLLHKTNSFHDCIAAAEEMLDLGMGFHSDSMALEGHSAGGLVAAAVANMRPELFRAMLLLVPFIDVLGDMMDETLHLTPFEYEDWGDPRDEAMARFMASYSPYDGVRTQQYPSMLAVGVANDRRVGPWHPLSFIARVREAHEQAGGDPRLHLAYIKDQGGHLGGLDVDDRHMELAFLHQALGM